MAEEKDGKEEFENLMRRRGVTEHGRLRYLQYLLGQKQSDKHIQREKEIEALKQMIEGEKGENEG